MPAVAVPAATAPPLPQPAPPATPASATNASALVTGATPAQKGMGPERMARASSARSGCAPAAAAIPLTAGPARPATNWRAEPVSCEWLLNGGLAVGGSSIRALCTKHQVVPQQPAAAGAPACMHAFMLLTSASLPAPCLIDSAGTTVPAHHPSPQPATLPCAPSALAAAAGAMPASRGTAQRRTAPASPASLASAPAAPAMPGSAGAAPLATSSSMAPASSE